jgi:hypothetical protein
MKVLMNLASMMKREDDGSEIDFVNDNEEL